MGAAFEYTGVTASSTFAASSTNTSYPATSTSITSLSAVGQSYNELYFGATTFSALTTVAPGSGWTACAGETNNSTKQALYTEEISTTTVLTTAATWTAATGTTYGAIIGIFRSPYALGYAATGTLDSSIFDTGSASGTQLNSLVWNGNASHGTAVGFQVAVSSSTGGPWNFMGPGGTSAITDIFSGSPGASIPLVSTTGGGYSLFNGYRYFRYRVILFADVTQSYTPTVNQVVVNWSP